jgi:hypothetical protein
MSRQSTIIHLHPSMFTEKEKILLEHGKITAYLFTYSTGVMAVRISNGAGQLIILPFQGMQIWSANFLGRDLTMRTNFSEPRPTQDYLQTYGGFLLHCGATSMGVPTKDDNHPLHGELPNAKYEAAYMVVGEDEQGEYLSVGGNYHHIVTFNHNYTAEPMVTLHSGSSLFGIDITINNLKNTPMEFMYLAHINYRPVDHGRLVYSALCSPETVRVRKSIPSHIKPAAGYAEYLQELSLHPEKHHELKPGLSFDPEVVFTIDYLADEAGWAHTLQVHPDGSADYVQHRPEQLNKGVRWISRTPDQDCLGIVLPATAEPEGYSLEKAKGNIKIIPPQTSYRINMVAGALSADQARFVEDKINQLIHR